MSITYKRVKTVTVGMLSLPENQAVIVRFDSPMRESDIHVENKAPATVANVYALETGTDHIMICNIIVQNELNKAYPDDSYVGKVFEITRGKSSKTKNGNNVVNHTIFEIELTGEEE